MGGGARGGSSRACIMHILYRGGSGVRGEGVSRAGEDRGRWSRKRYLGKALGPPMSVGG